MTDVLSFAQFVWLATPLWLPIFIGFVLAICWVREPENDIDLLNTKNNLPDLRVWDNER